MLSLRNVIYDDAKFLYELLKERTPAQSISHKKMPTWEEHLKFIKLMPYKAWWIIFDAEPLGMAYLTKQDEIVVNLLKKYWNQGYGKRVFQLIMNRRPERKFYAHVNPNNKRNIGILQKMGFKKLQLTFVKEI